MYVRACVHVKIFLRLERDLYRPLAQDGRRKGRTTRAERDRTSFSQGFLSELETRLASC